MQLELGKLLKIPRGSPDLPPMEFELGDVEVIEKRKVEISYATKETAPELMQIFNTGYCMVTRMMAQVSYEYTQAKKWADKRKAVIILDVAPAELERRSMRTSEDAREAVLNLDPQYELFMDKVNMLEAAYEFLRSKAKGLEMAYQSAKKIFDITHSGLGSIHHNLSGGITEEASPEPEHPLIGKPRY